MEHSYPDRAPTRPQPLFRALIVAVFGAVLSVLASYAPVLAQDLPADAPISIDAESSEFDYATSRLVFRKLRMDQGNLGIEADLAETDRLDFSNGLWVFTGNVKVRTETADLYCDEARLTFRDHQLAEAELSGSPARFEQRVPETGKVNTGEAEQIFYTLASETLKLQSAARFTDGSNEISGDQIIYDLKAQRLTAGSGDSGPVKILIETPNQLKNETDAP